MIKPEQTAKPTLKSSPINYYVATTGSDSNPGTSAAPFRTIQKAANVVNPGDVVIIRAGIYSSTGSQLLSIKRSGSADAPITFRSETKWGAVFDGLNTGNLGIVFSRGASYIKIQDIEIRSFLNHGIIHNDASYISSFITVEGCKIHDIGRIIDDQPIGRCAIYLRMKSHHWIIARNLIYNIGRIGPDTYYLNKDHSIYIGAVDVITNAAHDNQIIYNIIWGCSGQAITGCSSNDIIANNIIGWNNYNSQGATHELFMDEGTNNLSIVNNIFIKGSYEDTWVVQNNFQPVGWTVKNNLIVGGRMWWSYSSEAKSSMKGNNRGKTDCELPEVDPKFVSAIQSNALNADFCLQASSPAIDAGVGVGLTSDYLKNTIIGTPDIGAIEYAQLQSSTVYYNAEVTTTAVKNNCGTGYIGSTVTYTVAAGKYSSTISQSDADSKAAAELSANAQTYVNANGSCSFLPVYYNVLQSETATKNDCGTGYIGSTVTYIVPANKYSSTISQADADSKAVVDLRANKQAYANANGICMNIYYNVKVSATASRNNCPLGYRGTTVTYTVPAGKYSSTISQTDANNKAYADLYANKQAYANKYGSCIRRY